MRFSLLSVIRIGSPNLKFDDLNEIDRENLKKNHQKQIGYEKEPDKQSEKKI